MNAPPLFILLGVTGAFLFTRRALQVDQVSRRTGWVIRACAAVALATALALLGGAIDYGTAQSVGMALGPTPLLLVLPIAYRRWRAGDLAARFMLMGWGAYALGVLVLVGMLGGWLPASFVTLHAFQFASLVEMFMWMAVLGHRVHEIRLGAAQLQRDRDAARHLARTDALTGLLNRRGLQEAVLPLLAGAGPQRLVALYLLDLDGFKPVNDTLGHDAGDELLVGVAGRLQARVRATDLVCRLGGDEFVVVAAGMASPADAAGLGDKLLDALRTPLAAGGRACRVGVTIGYALAPLDETGLDGLMRRADAAMYVGKQAGRGRVERGAAGVALAGGGTC